MSKANNNGSGNNSISGMGANIKSLLTKCADSTKTDRV